MDPLYSLAIDRTMAAAPIAALIWGEGIDPPGTTIDAPEFLESLLARVRSTGETFVPQETRTRVRKMLRFGKYRPSGRGKPASEFLLRAALGESFPLINGPVDVNNAISLESGLPGSLFDAAITGPALLLRHGLEDESYVFNASGQTIDLEDLLVVCRRTEAGWAPCGNPVKDSMATKIGDATKDVLAVLYAPSDEPIETVEALAARYAELLRSHCGAERVGFQVVSGGRSG